MPSFTSLLVLALSATTLYAKPICQPPTILQPTANTNTPTMFTLSGRVVPNTECANGMVRIMTREQGQIRLAPTDGNGHFSVRLINRPYGTQHYYLLHTSDTKETLPSNVVAITTICGVPSIITPVLSPSGPRTTVTSSRVTVKGYSDCPFVTIETSGQSPITVATDVYGAFSVQTKYLPNNSYTFSAVAASDRRGSNSARSANRNVLVQSSEPAPTGAIQRRAQTIMPACASDQQLCEHVGVSDVGFKCYADLSSNLERCGSCAGPDCSALPHVKDVSCQESQCRVHSCSDGFVLVDNACISEQ